MTSKEALDNIKYIDLYGRYPYPYYLKDDLEYKEAIDVLEQLVDRDTPKNLVLKAGSFFNISIICPSCGFSINTERPELHNSIMFCERCGQKINLVQRV